MGYHVTIMDVLQAADRVAADAELASVVGQHMNVVCYPVDSAVHFHLMLLKNIYYCIFRRFFIFFYLVLAGVDGSLNNATIPSNRPINAMNWNKYQRLKVIYDYLLHMELSHPDIVQVNTLEIGMVT